MTWYVQSHENPELNVNVRYETEGTQSRAQIDEYVSIVFYVGIRELRLENIVSAPYQWLRTMNHSLAGIRRMSRRRLEM